MNTATRCAVPNSRPTREDSANLDRHLGKDTRDFDLKEINLTPFTATSVPPYPGSAYSGNPAQTSQGTQQAELPLPPQSNPHGLTASPSQPPASSRPGQLSAGLPPSLPSFIPTIITLVGRILQELDTQVARLLSLNPSRREAIAQHLDRLAGNPPGPTFAGGSADAAGGLRRWIEGPRTSAQNQALQAFFEEFAMTVLGQALVLKAWSDRGIRPWNEADVGRLNWALSTALKPHVPLDREGWQITRPNLYSWYNPSPSIQREIWKALEGWRVTEEGPELLAGILRLVRQTQPAWPEMKGYDQRFFQSLWDNIGRFGFDPEPDNGPLRRKRIAFTPTLRDGSMVRSGPSAIGWVGLDSYPFQLMMGELFQLWWGPSAPPLWSIGTGLEVHSRDQLDFKLSTLGSPKPSLFSRIAELEACDLAFVLEERTIRIQARSPDSLRFKEHVDSLPYFKKLKTSGTSLGDLQACVAISKLRPGGLLWWAREEPLTSNDGKEMLGFIFDRSKLLCEWNLSGLEHTLPVSAPLFPKYLYLFARETDLHSRLAHRPVRVSLHGQIRSHVEVPIVLSDAFQAFHDSRSAGSVRPRGHWQIFAQQSPTAQKDWAERWPDSTSHDVAQVLERMRSSSTPLGTVSTVRTAPTGAQIAETGWSVHASLHGLWVRTDHVGEGRKLVASPLPRQGGQADTKGNGFIVLVSDSAWIAPLGSYLESGAVQSWLDHHTERRSDRWTLKEQDVKWIPMPNALLRALGGSAGDQGGPPSSFAIPLPGEWERLASEIPFQPKLVREAVSKLGNEEADHTVRAALFVRTSRAIEHIRSGQNRLLSMVSSDGRIRWRDLLGILPKNECIPVTLHPGIRLSGALPPHVSIGRIDRVKIPSPGILLSTEQGFHFHVGSDLPMLIDMLWDQLQGLHHPTWHELTQYLRLPRNLDFAEATASEVLRSHGEQTLKLQQLQELLETCCRF